MFAHVNLKANIFKQQKLNLNKKSAFANSLKLNFIKTIIYIKIRTNLIIQ